jgi:glycerol uptake facilitator-like aquaporin
MQELIFFIVFILWYSGALIVAERIGKNSRLGEEWTFFIAFMLTPLVAAILGMAMPKKQY